MINKLLTTYIVFDILFLLGGVALVVVSLEGQAIGKAEATVDNIATILLIDRCPIIPSIANAGLVFASFLVSIPALVFRNSRIWLKLHGWMVVLSGLFTLGVGLRFWYETLKTRSLLKSIWMHESVVVRSLLQQRFDCCGYTNSTSPLYQVDSACPSDLVAAQKPGCVGPFSSFANSFLDVIFTANFGIVG
ncbi:phospholipid scramblase 1 [Myotisia sp. PD_48]|nr:phospholipid scramblase 1 [Myotisia sp. PD_48]